MKFIYQERSDEYKAQAEIIRQRELNKKTVEVHMSVKQANKHLRKIKRFQILYNFLPFLFR
jgi:ABC-type uncharacterized transport system substrate-binding protein